MWCTAGIQQERGCREETVWAQMTLAGHPQHTNRWPILTARSSVCSGVNPYLRAPSYTEPRVPGASAVGGGLYDAGTVCARDHRALHDGTRNASPVNLGCATCGLLDVTVLQACAAESGYQFAHELLPGEA